MILSQSIIRKLFENENLLLSPLSLQELVFTLSKLNIGTDEIKNTYSLFSSFCKHEIGKSLVDSAFEIANTLSFGENINDIIHLKFAEKYCTKLETFDRDFKKLQPHSKIEINILGNKN